MELYQMRYVLAVADHGNFTRAAAALHVVQPALSQGIRRLEKELGLQLFDRIPRGIRPTAAGDAFIHHIRRALADVERAERAVAELRDLKTGRVALGLTPSATIAVLPRLLEMYRSEFPGIQVEVVEEMTDALVDLLAAGRVDLALVSLPIDAAEIVAEPLYDERLALTIGRDHRLVGAKCVTLADLAEEMWILPYRRHGVRRLIEEACEAAGFVPRIAVELTGLGPIKELVKRGLGISVLPPAVVAPEASLGLLAMVPISSPALIRTVGVARRSGDHLTRAAARMLDMVRAIAEDMTNLDE
ncbi:MAG TPA: LysR substrate-binding domain-containing protein [Chloroflexota bacterium]|nr:LysR substrate-binding domain-containing protein [Chloroflexota bacterium]